MYGRTHVARFLVAAMAAGAVLVACSGSPSSTVPTAPTGAGAAAVNTMFRPATISERSQKRPSLAVGSHLAWHDGHGNPGYYTLVTSLKTDTQLDLARATTNCDASIFDAPWYVALGNFNVAVPSSISIPDCTGATPTPTPSPTPVATSFAATRDTSSQAAGAYVIQVDIGWFDLDIDTLAGPASDAGGTWTFASDESNAKFQWGHLYSFFVATWTPGTSPGSF